MYKICKSDYSKMVTFWIEVINLKLVSTAIKHTFHA